MAGKVCLIVLPPRMHVAVAWSSYALSKVVRLSRGPVWKHGPVQAVVHRWSQGPLATTHGLRYKRIDGRWNNVFGYLHEHTVKNKISPACLMCVCFLICHIFAEVIDTEYWQCSAASSINPSSTALVSPFPSWVKGCQPSLAALCYGVLKDGSQRFRDCLCVPCLASGRYFPVNQCTLNLDTPTPTNTTSGCLRMCLRQRNMSQRTASDCTPVK